MASIQQYFWMALSLVLFTILYYSLYIFSVSTSLRTIHFLLNEDLDNTTSEHLIKQDPSQKLLVIFTTFRNTPEKFFVHRNVIINWASISPRIQPILFGNLSSDTKLVELAQSHGWILHPVPRYLNKTGPPFFKDMYRIAKHLISNSSFYGFCNSDILFTDSLLKTLQAVTQYPIDSNSSLIVGRRTNVRINESSPKPFFETLSIMKSATKGTLFMTVAEDYFFVGKPELFPWHTIKDVVIGRPAYDNYVVAQAIRGKVIVIDATRTLLAVHQTGKDGNLAGAKKRHSRYNKNIIGPYNYQRGATSFCPYETASDIIGDVFILKRIFKTAVPKPKPKTVPKLTTPKPKVNLNPKPLTLISSSHNKVRM